MTSAISILRPDADTLGHGSDWLALGPTDNFSYDDGKHVHWTGIRSANLEPLVVGTVIENYILWDRDNTDRVKVTVTKVNRVTFKCIAEDDGQEYTIKVTR